MTHTPPLLFLDMADFAEHLRALRSQRQITQIRLATLLGVSPRVYNRWETGDAVPHFDTVVKIAEALAVSLDELAGRTAASDKLTLRNPELHQLYRQVDDLTDEDQQALLVVMDGLVKRTQIAKMLPLRPKPARKRLAGR
jgi:transcriptional regulator with XRE-family HTH domain